jgi:hypothetical protein
MLDQGPRRGQGVGAARADGSQTVGRLDDVAGAAQEQEVVAVQRDDHGFEAAQAAVHSPVLGQLGRRPRHAALIVFELGLEPFQKREGVGGRPGEADEHVAALHAADLVGVALHDDAAERHLAVAADGDAALVAHGQDGGGAQFGHGQPPFVDLRLAAVLQGDKGKLSPARRPGREENLGTWIRI